MSQQTVSEILIKAITNKEYREMLFSQPDATLAGLDLTEQEMTVLKKLDRGVFDAAAIELETRLFKAGRDLSGLDVVLLQCNQVDGAAFVNALNLGELFNK
jgi:hypothetical protein